MKARIAVCMGGLVILVALGCSSHRHGHAGDNTQQDEPTTPAKTTKDGQSSQPAPKVSGGIWGVGERQKIRTKMENLGLAYMTCVTERNKGPAKLDDLGRDALGKDLYEWIQNGWIVFFWNVRPDQMTAGSHETILAFTKDADTSGIRLVLFGDGHVENVPNPQFQAAPKAGPWPPK